MPLVTPRAVAGVAAALSFESVFLLFGSLFPGSGGTLGAPFPAGRSSGLGGGVISLGGSSELWPLPLAVDVGLAVVLFWLAGRAGGVGAIAGALVGSLAGLAPVVAVIFSYHNVTDPQSPAGFPFVAIREPYGSVDQLALFGDALAAALAGSGTWVVLSTSFPALRAGEARLAAPLRWPKHSLPSFVVALAVVLLVNALAFLYPNAEGTYGGPLPVGTTGFDPIYGDHGPSTLSVLIVIVNLVLTWAIYLAIVRWSGVRALGVGGALAVASLIAVAFSLPAPWLAVPLPLAAPWPPFYTALWANAIVWSAVAAAAYRLATAVRR